VRYHDEGLFPLLEIVFKPEDSLRDPGKVCDVANNKDAKEEEATALT